MVERGDELGAASVMSGIPMMRCLALVCSDPRSLFGMGIRVLDASRLPPGAAVSLKQFWLSP
jgi:hypothetical protein